MKGVAPALLIGAGIALFVLVSFCLYVVDETQQVVLTRFGEPVGDPVLTPGLNFKSPLENANYFDKRFLEWDGDPNQMPTRDKRFVWIDSYARWRIQDPLQYFLRNTNEITAQSRLDDILDGATRNAVARHDLIEVVRSSNRTPDTSLALISDEETSTLDPIEKGRQAIVKEILEGARRQVEDLGIELMDFQFKRLSYVEQVQQDVFARMIAERQRAAEKYRSEGAGEAARIRGEKERELNRIQSEAYRAAEEVRGKADAEATDIYAGAYQRDPGFYALLKTLQTYESSADSNTFMILSTDGELLKYLKNPQ